MDKRYEVYALADRFFYETPNRVSSTGTSATTTGTTGATALYETARRPVPDGWRTQRTGDWLVFAPVDDTGHPLTAPSQGWKIHVSATGENAEKTAAVVADYCLPRGIPFKFVPGARLLHLRNSKYAPRDGSGKFATLYPADGYQLRTTLTELGGQLDGFDGPYVLTDLRWHNGPLYVRYGAFARRFCLDGRGTLVPAIENAAGDLVPDPRDPAFQVPEWVKLPGFLEPHLAARNATTVSDLPYRIEKALHFSNGGGVYAGTDTRDASRVVLKEGRPHAGLAADGADAVARLEREKAALERLSGLGVAPEARDWFTLGDHRFLVMDFLPGRTLNSFLAERHPLCTCDPDPAAIADYTDWALGIHRAVEEAVAAVHGRGVVFNDLHLFNIMVAPDERSVALLDFEAATTVGDSGRQVVAHPGFMAPAGRTGTDIDRYALACLRIALFLPITSLFAIDRGKAAHLAEVAAGLFPGIPDGFLDEAVTEITRDGDRAPVPQGGGSGATSTITAGAGPGGGAGAGAEAGGSARWVALAETGDWPRSRDSMVAAILASATPDRDDRLFPGDIAQFSEGGGLGLAYGAAGVLHALAETGAERYEQGERWLLAHTDPVPAGTPLGLYDGLAGVAYVLDRLGHRQRALDLADQILREPWQRLTPDLHSGLAGLGLVLDALAHTTGESALRGPALRAAELVGDRLTAAEPGPPASRRAGLLRGSTGAALLFLRLHERTQDPDLLDQAARALRADLGACVSQPDGSLAVDEGWRTMPYLGEGSVGIGMVIDDYLARSARPAQSARSSDEEFTRARTDILAAARSGFYAQPGLFRGRAGMVLHLSRSTATPETAAALAAQIAGLGWYAMPYAGQLAFPGDQMMRLSMDLGTGTAGCLLALGAALGDTGAHLPFLPPPPPPPLWPSSRLRDTSSTES
ncbi:class III lanthionine synthetase LanKC [Streptomyces apocyni]|uniref:class III lanthionine synthetase LanKC n=1 Tax=Streptomyces apocyni TaxID=2654677 RepID=UPI0012EAF42B|nr:class III lanthionine synthetase LanKC [Streptomyces apocyni]